MVQKILKEIVKEITPTAEDREKIDGIIKDVTQRLEKEKTKEVEKIELMGSVAKDTYLRGEYDIDIFLLLNKKVEKERFGKIVKEIAKRSFPKERIVERYAEHPYVSVYYKGVKIDIVPAYRINNIREKASSVDRSYFHKKYVLRNLKKRQRKDVRLLKKILKANGLYGAEIKIEGFSGYACELLIIKYKTFRNLMKYASSWRIPKCISLKRDIKEKRCIEMFNAPLILLDPVDRNRNVCAAVTKKNLRRFIELAREFEKRPKKEMFFRDPKEVLYERTCSFENPIVVAIKKNEEIVEDIFWGQIKKLGKKIYKYLDQLGFEPYDYEFIEGKKEVYLILGLMKNRLKEYEEIKGPPVNMKKHALRFMKKHLKTFEKNGHIYAIEKRNIRNPKQGIMKFLLDERLPSHIRKEDIKITNLRHLEKELDL